MDVSCQCGEVRFKTGTDIPLAVFICHCVECRKQSGSAFSVTAIFPRFEIPREVKKCLKIFQRTTALGGILNCYFCSCCGSRVLHDTANKNITAVKGGLIDGLDFKSSVHLWAKVAVMPIPAGATQLWEDMDMAEFAQLNAPKKTLLKKVKSALNLPRHKSASKAASNAEPINMSSAKGISENRGTFTSRNASSKSLNNITRSSSEVRVPSNSIFRKSAHEFFITEASSKSNPTPDSVVATKKRSEPPLPTSITSTNVPEHFVVRNEARHMNSIQTYEYDMMQKGKLKGMEVRPFVVSRSTREAEKAGKEKAENDWLRMTRQAKATMPPQEPEQYSEAEVGSGTEFLLGISAHDGVGGRSAGANRKVQQPFRPQPASHESAGSHHLHDPSNNHNSSARGSPLLSSDNEQKPATYLRRPRVVRRQPDGHASSARTLPGHSTAAGLNIDQGVEVPPFQLPLPAAESEPFGLPYQR